jgi:hypothetical protein
VQRRHALAGGADSASLAEDMQKYQFALILPRGEEDLHGVQPAAGK